MSSIIYNEDCSIEYSYNALRLGEPGGNHVN